MAFMICLTVATGVVAGTSARVEDAGRPVRAPPMMKTMPPMNSAALTRNSHCTSWMRERAIDRSLPLPLLGRFVPHRPAVLRQSRGDELERQIRFVASGHDFEVARIPRRFHRALVGLFSIIGIGNDGR